MKCGPSPSKLAFWVDWKMADIISPLPGCSKRKSGKSISVEQQQIVLNDAKYFQEESKSGNKPQFRAGAVIGKTAAATGISKNSVRKIVSAGKVIGEGKTRKAKVRFGKLDNFDVGVIRRIIHNLYRENISPSLKKKTHEILRLPPYHCELNPIELAWAAEKNYVAGENKDMSLDSEEKLFRKKREELPEDFWRKCVEHVKKIEENCWESDRIQDNKVEQLIIKLKPTDSSSSEMESFLESSDSSNSDQP